MFEFTQKPPRWDDSPEDLVKVTDKFIKEAKEFDDWLALVENPTIDNFLKPWIARSSENSNLVRCLQFYKQVSPDAAIRTASSDCLRRIDDYYIESEYREDIFLKFKQVYEANKDVDLEPELARYIDKKYRIYKRQGLDLPTEKRKKNEQLSKELASLANDYTKNVNEQTEHLLFTEEELQGVPENVMAQFAKVDGKFKVTYKYPDILPVIKYATKSITRKTAFLGNQNKVSQNIDILKQTVVKRAELAHVLGYSTFADYALEERMAKNSATVLAFENDLWSKLKPKGLAEAQVLKSFKINDYKEQGLDVTTTEANTLYLWDFQYYHNMLLKTQYKVDEQKIAEYFPLKSTIANMLGFYETLFLLKFVEQIENKQVWHEDVKQFSIWNMDDVDNPIFLGHIYFDLHPRDGKYGHAACFTLRAGYYDETNDTKVRPVNALVCNFSKPQEGKPALLKHSEVKTFFHELGHGIHSIVSDVKYSKFHGTLVARDFVECPSQMLEFWVWSAPELKKLSSHYITGEPLPDDLINALANSKSVDSGLLLLRQLHLGLFDMALHNSKDGNVDIDQAWNELRQKVGLMGTDGEITKGYATFGHMIGGYAAGYYGYMYSRVFAVDIYYSLFKADPFNKTNGKRYRDTVLKRGGTKDELDMLKELLGREPNSDAFLADIGVDKARL